jgi:hypothetical protein
LPELRLPKITHQRPSAALASEAAPALEAAPLARLALAIWSR